MTFSPEQEQVIREIVRDEMSSGNIGSLSVVGKPGPHEVAKEPNLTERLQYLVKLYGLHEVWTEITNIADVDQSLDDLVPPDEPAVESCPDPWDKPDFDATSKAFGKLGKPFEELMKPTQLTLGELIKQLKATPQHYQIVWANGYSPGYLCSYRGHHEQLAITTSPYERWVSRLLNSLETATLSTFEGYKGGQYQMNENTPVWCVGSPSETSRVMVVDVVVDDKKHQVVLKTRLEDDDAA